MTVGGLVEAEKIELGVVEKFFIKYHKILIRQDVLNMLCTNIVEKFLGVQLPLERVKALVFIQELKSFAD